MFSRLGRLLVALPVVAFGAGCERGGDGSPASTVTLLSLQAGDAACYVAVREPGGAERSYHGAFELCEEGAAAASALIGRMVRLDVGRERVLADTCAGDPECSETQEVDFVKAIEAAAS